jgi:hypothetical protein
MTDKKTAQRGFDYIEFVDRYGEKCSLQESSLATESAVWFGIDNPIPKVLKQGHGWVRVDLPEGTLISGRMHLTQKMVKDILPHLIKFAETGGI